MLPKYIAQLIVVGTQVVGRALARAVREEFAAGRQAAARQGDQTGRSAATNAKHGMTLQEATQILNIPQEQLLSDDVLKRYEHLVNINQKSKGGSLYLQAKIMNAKERIDEELKHLADANKQP